MRRPTLIALAALLLGGCGERRTEPPDVRHPDPPQGTRAVDLADGAISFVAPANWMGLEPRPPLEGGISSKAAVVAVWRYPRAEPLPGGDGALERAMDRLVERIEARDPTFAVRSSELTTRGGARGIELTGSQTVGGRRVTVRSAHLFAAGAEVVVDAYAPPEDFAQVDATVFVPLLESLELAGT